MLPRRAPARPSAPSTARRRGSTAAPWQQAVRQALLLLPEHGPRPDPGRICAKSRGLCPLAAGPGGTSIFPPDSGRRWREAKRNASSMRSCFLLQIAPAPASKAAARGGIRALAACRSGRRGGVLAAAALYAHGRAAPRRARGRGRHGARPRPMRRLVQGDVGSGKTAVAAALCWQAAKNGAAGRAHGPHRAAGPPALRHALRLLLPASDVHTGAAHRLHAQAGARRRSSPPLADGTAQVAVGTHALLSEGVAFAGGWPSPSRTSSTASAWASAPPSRPRAAQPHLLVMSATPIPRTLALMLYGDLDLSVLDELPPGTHARPDLRDPLRQAAAARSAFVRRHAQAGRQTYIICPMIDEGDDDRASVTQYAARLAARKELPGLADRGAARPHEARREGGRHGALRLPGNWSVLVSTTVVEVGVDVPNAAVMLIENAERYGLSQLHQLRGRVGRGSQCSPTASSSRTRRIKEAQAPACACCAPPRTASAWRTRTCACAAPATFFGRRQHGLPHAAHRRHGRGSRRASRRAGRRRRTPARRSHALPAGAPQAAAVCAAHRRRTDVRLKWTDKKKQGVSYFVLKIIIKLFPVHHIVFTFALHNKSHKREIKQRDTGRKP